MNYLNQLTKKCFLYVLLFSTSLGATAQPSLQPETNLENKTYTFKNLPDTSLQLTVFYPKGHTQKSKLPVMILFHGGGWIKGSRKVMYPICEYFTNRGIITISASYRLIKENASSIEATKEMCIYDAKSAVRWVRQHGNELGIDTSKIILGGGSAGGHLATMAALDIAINDPADNKSISTRCIAMVLFNPAYLPDDSARLQPFTVAATTPPSIMFFGTKDILRKSAQLFCKGTPQKAVTIWYAPGQKHAFFNQPDWRDITCSKADEFLVAQHLLPPGTKPPASDLKLLPNDN